MCALTAGAFLRAPLAVFGQRRGGADPRLDFEIPYEATTSPIFYFSRATFEPYVGGIFAAPGPGGQKVQLRLVGITDYAPSARTRLTTRPHRRTNCFSLQFRAAGPLRQLTSIHNLEHGALGHFDLFLTESEARGALFYEAVFNQVVAS